MSYFDDSQQRVFQLDPSLHARIIGAPGSGKTRLLVESYAMHAEQFASGEDELLVLAPNRLSATALRRNIEERVNRAIGGTPVRTAVSFAFSILTREAALRAGNPPRLLTGTAYDEVIAQVVNERLGQAAEPGPFAPEVVLTQAFRSELRELARIFDDFGVEAVHFAEELAAQERLAASEALSVAPAPELIERWIEGAQLLDAVKQKLSVERPGEQSASGLLAAAREAIVGGDVRVPRLILVDDAQDLGEGSLALLAACAQSGSAVWVFGDPDISIGAFQGERSSVMKSLVSELARRGAKRTPREPIAAREQVVLLEQVHRQGPVIREFVRSVTSRIGVAGGAEHRRAVAADRADEERTEGRADTVEFTVADSSSQQLGIIAHRMRARKLGVGGRVPRGWSEMAVVCRSRGEAVRIARLLSSQQVPAGVAAGGVVLREYQVVRELIRMLQHALGLAPLDASGVLQLAGGVLGGLDPVALRRLRGSLLIQERRDARAEEREAMTVEEIVFDSFMFPGASPVIDSAGGRAIRKLGRMAAAARAVHGAGGTPRETLWALWEASRLADAWQTLALDGRGASADEANRSLDAVMGLFFALQRHEEQDSDQPVSELLTDLLENTVPEDSLASRGEKDRVTVTTPQGLIGREFAIVAVVGVQDGAWPNVKARGSMLGTAALERWLKGGEALPQSRRETIHDELRLFAHASARAREELLVVAVADEDQHPSPFFGLGAQHRVEGLPNSRLTLRGLTAAMRRRLVLHSDDTEAAQALAVLSEAHVPGAHPDEWYGVAPPSSDAPLYSLSTDGGGTDEGCTNEGCTDEGCTDEGRGRRIPVSPSQLEKVEDCALDWVIGALGGSAGSVQASLGTLVHHALETAETHDAEEILEAIEHEWGKLSFDSDWEAERARRTAAAMARGLSGYLREFAASDRTLLGKETSFSLGVGQAELRGVADRLEARHGPGGTELTVVDLKTGRTPVTGPAAEKHVQLQAYQLGLTHGAFDIENVHGAGDVSTSAKLLYVHPDAAKGKGYVERAQAALDAETQSELIERVANAARVMAAGEFTARIEHHCSDPHAPGNCRLHIIQAVSHP